MKKPFIIFAVIAIVAVLALAFLTQDNFRHRILGEAVEPDEASQIEQDAIKLVTNHLREQQVAEYELLVEAFMERYPLTVEDDVWRLIVVVLEADYRCREQIEVLEKGK